MCIWNKKHDLNLCITYVNCVVLLSQKPHKWAQGINFKYLIRPVCDYNQTRATNMKHINYLTKIMIFWISYVPASSYQQN